MIRGTSASSKLMTIWARYSIASTKPMRINAG
jgi:hypothetical protein